MPRGGLVAKQLYDDFRGGGDRKMRKYTLYDSSQHGLFMRQSLV